MKIGDLEGKGKLYDEEGEAILQSDEHIKKRFSGWCINWATRKKGKIHGIMNFEGEGEFIITDRRLIFLRKPREFPPGYWAVGREAGGLVGDELPGGGDWQYALARSNRAKEKGGLEFLVIDFNEIKRINIGKDTAKIFIENDDKFQLIIDNNSGEILAEFFGEES
ncbi:MAG: hypothetical protein JSW00_19515 [Thermoplasmata archaeon]|nr:MAG: hypothetical protein JSW00_19515 [Thermoplasmata archaeon]